MYQQNKKNGNLILMKNRRILTRTQQSKQKLKANLNNNNIVYKTHRQEQNKILKYQERKNHTQHKPKSNQGLDHAIFWKAAKNKRIKDECYSSQKTQSFYESQSPRNYIKAEDRPKVYSKNNSRVYGILKKKIFSHKNLIQGSERIRSNTSESTLRINNDNNITQNQIPSDNTQCQDSQRITQRTYFLKGIKNFTKRFKTENIEPEQNNVQKVLKSIYSSRRRKLRLNSNEFSVELRMNVKKQIQEDQALNIRQEDTLITTRTQNRKSLKLPKQLINKIKEKGQKSEAISSPVNLSFSSDNDNLQRKNFNIELKNYQNKNQKEMVVNRKKSRTFLSRQSMYKIQEYSLLQKDYNGTDQFEQKSSRDQRFAKKQTPHVVKNPKSKIFQSQTISIQDIDVVCLNESQNATQKNSLRQNDQEIQKKTIDKNQSHNISQNRNQKMKLIVSSPLEKKKKKLRIKQQSPIKKIQRQETYNDAQQIGFMEQINFSNPQNITSIQMIKDSPKSHDISLLNPKILNTYTIESLEEQKTKRQKMQKQQSSFLQNGKQIKIQTIKLIKVEKQQEEFLRLKNTIQELNCIGQVGGQCSQCFPKKNLTWMVLTLLLYVYCLNFRNKAKQIFESALKSQFCLQSQYQNLVQQNQHLQLNISKIYQKSKKKNLITQQIQVFIESNFDIEKQKRKFLNALFNQLLKFVDLLIKMESKQPAQKRDLYICGIKMIMAFMVTLKTQKQSLKTLRDTNISSNKEVIIEMPQIEFSNLDLKKAFICLQQSLKLLKQTFQTFRNFANG